MIQAWSRFSELFEYLDDVYIHIHGLVLSYGPFYVNVQHHVMDNRPSCSNGRPKRCALTPWMDSIRPMRSYGESFLMSAANAAPTRRQAASPHQLERSAPHFCDHFQQRPRQARAAHRSRWPSSLFLYTLLARQVFIQKADGEYTFVGDYDGFESLVECETLPK